MVRMSLILAEDVVRYARWLSELINGKVEVQSRARRSYRAVVMPTDALLTFGILKLTSLILIEYEELWRGQIFPWMDMAGKVDGCDRNEGVGSNAGREQRRFDELLQLMNAVERCFVLC